MQLLLYFSLRLYGNTHIETMIKTTTRFINQLYSTATIPELQFADQLCATNHFSEASQNYQRVLQILESSKMEESEQYHSVSAK